VQIIAGNQNFRHQNKYFLHNQIVSDEAAFFKTNLYRTLKPGKG
jgi:hypothetical protein